MIVKQPTIKQLVTANAGVEKMPNDHFYVALTINLNRFRGTQHEKMAYAVVLKNAVEILELPVPVLSLDRKIFKCFDEGTVTRRCDIYLEQANIAYEVKSYRPVLSRFVREQIRKDEWLLKSSHLSQVWWLLFHGASPSVLRELTRSGIVYINVPEAGDEFTNIPQLLGSF